DQRVAILQAGKNRTQYRPLVGRERPTYVVLASDRAELHLPVVSPRPEARFLVVECDTAVVALFGSPCVADHHPGPLVALPTRDRGADGPRLTRDAGEVNDAARSSQVCAAPHLIPSARRGADRQRCLAASRDR